MLDKTKYLSKKESLQLMNFCKRMSQTGKPYYIRGWMGIDILMNTGMRASECRMLKVGDLYLGDEPSILIRHGKNGKSRTCEISLDLKKHLQQYLKWKKEQGENTSPEAYLILNKFRKFYTLYGFQCLFKNLTKGAGLRECYGVHSLRHTFGYMVYGKTKNIRLCQSLLGHQSISSTLIYSHVDHETKIETINGLWS